MTTEGDLERLAEAAQNVQLANQHVDENPVAVDLAHAQAAIERALERLRQGQSAEAVNG